MSGDEWPLAVVGPVEVVVAVDLEELGEAVGAGAAALGLADEDVGDGRALDGAEAGEGEAGRLRDQVVRVARVGRVVELADGDVDAGALLDRLRRRREGGVMRVYIGAFAV